MIFAYQVERRTRRYLVHAKAARKPLREMGLSRTEVTGKQNDIPWLSLLRHAESKLSGFFDRCALKMHLTFL